MYPSNPSNRATGPSRPSLHERFRTVLSGRQRTALVASASFAVTVLAARATTTAIRSGGSPLRDVVVGGVHVHHYLPGIALLVAAGGLGLRRPAGATVDCLLGATYGTGVALVADELPLLVSLRDVYWAPEGRWAVRASLAAVGVAGAYFAAQPLLRPGSAVDADAPGADAPAALAPVTVDAAVPDAAVPDAAVPDAPDPGPPDPGPPVADPHDLDPSSPGRPGPVAVPERVAP